MADRKKTKQLKPEDLTREEFGMAILKEFKQKGMASSLKHIVVVDEPHKKFNPSGDVRERHKHAVVFNQGGFAHEGVRKELSKKGIAGFWTFNLVTGFAAYLNYLFDPSHKKLQCVQHLVAVARGS